MEIFSGKPQTAKKSFLQRYYEKLYNPPGDSGTNETSDKSRIHKIAHKGTLKMWGMALGREFVSNFGEHKQNLQGDGKIFAVKKGKKNLERKVFYSRHNKQLLCSSEHRWSRNGEINFQLQSFFDAQVPSTFMWRFSLRKPKQTLMIAFAKEC